LRFDVSGNISDVSLAQFWAESRHAVFAIGHLISDGLFMAIVVVSEISLEIVLLERALTVNDVATSDMTGRAIGRTTAHHGPHLQLKPPKVRTAQSKRPKQEKKCDV
jgi:hypothetical protein